MEYENIPPDDSCHYEELPEDGDDDYDDVLVATGKTGPQSDEINMELTNQRQSATDNV